jgi:hypothetical protein
MFQEQMANEQKMGNQPTDLDYHPETRGFKVLITAPCPYFSLSNGASEAFPTPIAVAGYMPTARVCAPRESLKAAFDHNSEGAQLLLIFCH